MIKELMKSLVMMLI